MPLNIQVKRNGRILKGGPSGEGYGVNELNAFYTVAVGEAWPDLMWNADLSIGEILESGRIADFEMMGLPYLIPSEKVPVQKGEQIVQADHEFAQRTADGPAPSIRFKKGDILTASRS